jgi:two-component sensor histidine kinase
LASPAPIDINTDKPLPLLPKSFVYIDQQNKPISWILSHNKFHPYHQRVINVGVSKAAVWITFRLKNCSDKPITQFIVPTSSLLEEIILYDHTQTPLIHTGLMHTTNEHNTLYYYLPVTLQPHTTQTYYLRIQSFYSPVAFSLIMESQKKFLGTDKYYQAFNILLIGIVLSLMLYAFFLSFFIRDKSYFYYGLYLFALLYQQITYIGLTKIYFPLAFIPIDLELVLFKIVLLISTSALFAIHFLDTRKFPKIDLTYKSIVILLLGLLIITDPEDTYSLTLLILIGFMFITFNLFAGIYIFKKGYKQARLFIIGFSIVFITYLFIITDALGLTTVVVDYNNVLMLATVFEAFILSLAFADRYMILTEQKQKADQLILEESQYRAFLVEQEVKKKTEELNKALKQKELLMREIHHRVKNNLQIILSMLRLQSDEINDPEIEQKFINLEHRINAIAKTYSTLLISNELEEVDMNEYVSALLNDIAESYEYQEQQVDVITEVDDVTLPLKQAVYIGLVINELVTNAYKYAFNGSLGIIHVSLFSDKKGHYTLVIEDNGSGYTIDSDVKSLGLKLIRTLIYEQLEGSIEIDSYQHTKYTIRFTIE